MVITNEKELTKQLQELVHDAALEIAEGIKAELSSKTMVVVDENEQLKKVPYETEVVDDGETVSVVPLQDNTIDEYGSSETVAKHAFEGHMTLTKILNGLSK